MRKIIIIFTIFVLLSKLVYCINKPKLNIEIFDSLLNNSIELLKDTYVIKDLDTICLQLHNHPADFYIERNISTNISNKILIKAPCNSHSNKILPILDVIINKMIVEYNKIENNDNYMMRKISISLAFSFINSDRSIISLPEYSSIYSDTIKTSEINTIESNQYDFAKGMFPVEEQSLFSKILEPIVVIGTAIITIILLFTVRSS